MSRMLTSSIVLGVWSLAVWSGTPSAFAQAPPGNAAVKQPRPQNAALQVQKLPPALENLLSNWSQRSAKVDKLQGQHVRHVYDLVFGVEKRSTGVFYYEAPGKGRIDLRPVSIKEGEVSRKPDKSGKPFKLQSDRPERWICDGQDIWQVNDATKQVDIFTIPQENQGQNIMDGPMPFLFGMPPAKAKQRYILELVDDQEKYAIIKVKPRWQVDAANWQEAQVILSKEIYLPTAVKLIDPSGNLETVYQFGQFQINKKDPIWIVKVFGGDSDPFKPELKGYAKTVHKIKDNVAANAPPAAPPAAPTVPSVAGMSWQDAKTLLEKLECKVTPAKGQKAPRAQLSYVVYDQNPAPKTPLQKGMAVTLTVYDQAPPPQPTPKGQVPQVTGIFWKDAGATLEQAGYKVKYVPGKVATTAELTYQVYEQAPSAGAALPPGSEVTLTVYNQAK